MAITTEGKVFVWGCGENGQLGLGVDIKEALIPIEIGEDTMLENEKVIEGQTGHNHCIVMTESGSVYAWGQGSLEKKSNKDESRIRNKKDDQKEIEIKSFSVHKVMQVESIHKFLLKKKTKKVTKPKQYYSRK